MTTVYAVVLVAGVVGLVAWAVGHAWAMNVDRPDRDPEERLGKNGRRVVAGLLGFGLAGMSAEYAAIDIAPLAVFALAAAGALAAVAWAGYAGGDAGELE